MYSIYDESFEVTDDQVETYLETYPYGVTKPALEMIGEQMWVSKWMNWVGCMDQTIEGQVIRNSCQPIIRVMPQWSDPG